MTSAVLWTAGKSAKISVKGRGSRVDAGKSLATIESARYFGSLWMPFTCRIVEANALYSREFPAPSTIYDSGWLAEVMPLEPDLAPAGLVKGANARALIEAKVSSLHLKCFSALPDAEMLEIGTECNAVLARLNGGFSGKAAGYVIHLVTDDETSPIEMIRWSDESGNKIIERRKIDNLFHFMLMKA